MMRPLALHPWPLADELFTVIRQAKQAVVGDAYLVMPSPAVPGSDERVLAFGKLPNWVCDVALLAEPPYTFDRVAAALNWVLNGGEGGFRKRDYLAAIFGEPVMELFDA